MSRRREVFDGMTSRELRAMLVERQALRTAADRMRKELEEIRRALYQRIEYPLSWILQEGADAHEDRGNISESSPYPLSRRRHNTERDCTRWETATFRKVVIFARPAGIDLETLEYEVARWAEHPNTLGHIEAQEKLLAAHATQIRQQLYGLRAPCPLCGGTPQQNTSGYAWPEGLSRHLEAHGNVYRCPVVDVAFAPCREAKSRQWHSPVKPVGPAICHPNLPAYEYGQGECHSCYEAAWKAWRESIEAEITEWTRQLCNQSSHSWSPDLCVRCGVTRCRVRFSNGQRCVYATPCRDHPPKPPVSLEEHRRRGEE